MFGYEPSALWIGLGGFVGVNLRYLVNKEIVGHFGFEFPWGTLTANVTGSFLIGLVAEALVVGLIDDPRYRLMLVVGLLGGYTTFSTFALESVGLIEQERWLRAGAYMLGSNILAITACFAGILIVRRFA